MLHVHVTKFTSQMRFYIVYLHVHVFLKFMHVKEYIYTFFKFMNYLNISSLFIKHMLEFFLTMFMPCLDNIFDVYVHRSSFRKRRKNPYICHVYVISNALCN